MEQTSGIPPKSVTTLLRLEALAVLAASLAGYQILGGNWWLFALLILVPDLSIIGFAAGNRTGALIYNLVHSYAFALVLGAIGYFAGNIFVVTLALIWTTHIAADRVLGYGLKYPEGFGQTHLGVMGKARKAAKIADAG
jgi:hypothetical protein